MANIENAQAAIAEALAITERDGLASTANGAFLRMELRRAQDALIPDASDEIKGTIETRVVSAGEREQRIRDRTVALIEAWGSVRPGGQLLPDTFLERLARSEIAIEDVQPEHSWQPTE